MCHRRRAGSGYPHLLEEQLTSPQQERCGWKVPRWVRGKGESRKRGSAEDGNVSEAPVGSVLSQRMQGVLGVCEGGCEEGAERGR